MSTYPLHPTPYCLLHATYYLLPIYRSVFPLLRISVVDPVGSIPPIDLIPALGLGRCLATLRSLLCLRYVTKVGEGLHCVTEVDGE